MWTVPDEALVYKKGRLSPGCAPCTGAVTQGIGGCSSPFSHTVHHPCCSWMPPRRLSCASTCAMVCHCGLAQPLSCRFPWAGRRPSLLEALGDVSSAQAAEPLGQLAGFPEPFASSVPCSDGWHPPAKRLSCDLGESLWGQAVRHRTKGDGPVCFQILALLPVRYVLPVPSSMETSAATVSTSQDRHGINASICMRESDAGLVSSEFLVSFLPPDGPWASWCLEGLTFTGGQHLCTCSNVVLVGTSNEMQDRNGQDRFGSHFWYPSFILFQI